MILVAGGSGTLGSRLVPLLTGRGLQVRILTRDPSRIEGSNAVDVVRGDVRDQESIGRAMGGVRTVVSAVHGFVGPRGESPASVDRDGNVNLIEAARAGDAAFVMTSIVGASEDHPMDLMRMKHAAEERLRESGVPWTIVRTTAFFETWLALLEQTTRSGRPLVFGRGENPINFVSADDVAALVGHAVVEPTTRGRKLEIGGPEDLTMNRLAQALQHAAGRTEEPRHVPRPMLRAMARIMRPFKPELARQAQGALVMDTEDMTFHDDAARRAFPDVPSTTLDELMAARAGGAERPRSAAG